MDPLSLGVAQFHEALRAKLEGPAPGHDAAQRSAYRLLVDGVTPDELFKSMRLYEYRDDNRHPFVVLTDGVESEQQFVAAALAQLAGDEASIRKGLAEDGRAIPETSFASAERTAAGLCVALRRLGAAVSRELAGVVVVLAPSQVRDQAAYAGIANAIAQQASFPEVVVLARDHGIAAMTEAIPSSLSLHVDRKALAAHVRNLKSPHDVGPPRANAPQFTVKQRRDLEKKLGQRMLSKNTGQELKRLLFDAAAAQSEGRFELAAKRFRMARTLCFVTGLRQEQAMCAIAVGTAQFSCGRLDRALESYREGRALGAELNAPRLVMQAEVGIATAYLTETHYQLAREAYGRVYDAADGLAAMQIEAKRMQAECLVQERKPAEAVKLWLEALAEVEALDPLLRTSTSYKTVAKRLQQELVLLGRAHELPAIQQRVAAIESASAERAAQVQA